MVKYLERKEENYLHVFAQHNENCEKIWGQTNISDERGEFQRDRERIVNSKAFRRMVDKAQIFTSSKGDHYRTRMTHTMEVAQIARSIANSLRLNIDLTEAIALGHDVGHTPFGHQGERTLQDILNHKIEVGLPQVEEKNIYGGFKHNFQSVRVLNCLEEKYVAYEGLDISYQVLEGVLKHTGYHQKECGKCGMDKCPRKCCDLKAFLGKGEMDRLFTKIEFPTTLEGQVVSIADEIAQRSHDVDDAMSAGLLDYEGLRSFLEREKMEPLLTIINKSYDEIKASKREYSSIKQMVCARVISDIINYLINDAIQESKKRIEKFEENDFYKKEHRFSEVLVDFSETGKEICGLLEGMVKRIVINNPEIVKFDYNANIIVKKLFETYYHNPKLLHKGTLKKLEIEIHDELGERIDFAEGDIEEVQKQLSAISSNLDGTNLNSPEWKKHIILVRTIVDYIAGMTDSYARNEHASFCGE